MKKTVLEPNISDSGVVVQFSPETRIDKKISVKVPSGFQAVVMIGGKGLVRIPFTDGKKISDIAKEWVGKRCRVAFFRDTPFEPMSWGFGNVNVKNKAQNQSFRIGANGKVTFKTVSIGKMLSSFDCKEDITVDMIRSKVLGVVKNVGTTLLGAFFVENDVSVFEVSSFASELKNKFFELLKDEDAFEELGIELCSLGLDGLFIPDEDLEAIKKRRI